MPVKAPGSFFLSLVFFSGLRTLDPLPSHRTGHTATKRKERREREQPAKSPILSINNLVFVQSLSSFLLVFVSGRQFAEDEERESPLPTEKWNNLVSEHWVGEKRREEKPIY